MHPSGVNPVSATAMRPPTIALVGQPNCGKTTLFNRLTHSHFRTANYPGATVEYALGSLAESYGLPANVLDSPGLASLSAHSPDEAVTVKALFDHPTLGTPDVVVVVVDVSQLARHLFLAQQVIASGFPTVVAVTMGDLLTDKGYRFDAALFSTLLDGPAVSIDARSGDGVDALIAAVRAKLDTPAPTPPAPVLPGDDAAIQALYERADAIERAVVLPIDPQKTVRAAHALHPRTAQLDAVFLHPVWGLLVFALSMAAIFTAVFWLAEPIMDTIDGGFSWLAGLAIASVPGAWGEFLGAGLITGIGSVVMFLPQITILFLAMSFLEDSGYLARGAMLVDRPLSAIGLNGRSFVPMLSGFACAIPGMMAARTIPSRKERLLTIFIMPLMSCSARLPVYALLLAFLTPQDKPWIGGLGLTALYLASIAAGTAAAAIAGKFLKLQEASAFMLELPAYRRPQLGVVLRSTYHRAKHYLEKAGVPIMVVAVALWALTYFQVPGTPPATTPDEQLTYSYAAMIGHWLDPVMAPLGLDWRAGAAIICAFGAREVFVSSLALILKVDADGDALQGRLIEAMQAATLADGSPMFTTATVIGLTVFFIFALQCMATVVVSAKESGSRWLPTVQLVSFTAIAYLAALIAVHGLRAFGIA